jgi:hypothetical protein
MRIVLLILLCLVFAGCQPRKDGTEITKIPIKEKTLDAAEILKIEVFKLLEKEETENKTFFVANTYALEAALTRFSRVQLADDNYVLPTRKYVNDVILVAYSKFVADNRLSYSSRFDCDDYARLFAMFASLCNNLDGPAGYQGIAVGELWYMKEELIGKTTHAINVIVTSDQEVIFIEPQSGNLIHLSDAEIKSVKLIRF